MAKHFGMIFLVLFLLAGTSLHAAPVNLLVNPSFELSSVPLTTYYLKVNNGSDVLTGWNVGDTSIDIVQGSTWSYNGNRAIDLAGTPGPGSVYQTITSYSDSYLLSFYASSNGSAQVDQLWIYWGGTLIDKVDTPAQGNWQYYSYNLSGISSPTDLKFYTPNGSNAGPLLDMVTLQTPIPAAAWLLGTGLIGLTILRRRKQD